MDASSETDLSTMTDAEISAAVADRYGGVALDPDKKHGFPVGRAFAISVGYLESDLDALPAGCSESFTGAGNPRGFVALSGAERLLDVGCGAGLDACLYAHRLPEGRVTGLDFSPGMIEKATANAREAQIPNLEFRCEPAGDMPFSAATFDIVTANGILNLSPDRDGVLREIARVLQPGGAFIFAEITTVEERLVDSRETLDDWFRCIGGAETIGAVRRRLQRAGFRDVESLESRRNARTNHPATVCSVISAKRIG